MTHNYSMGIYEKALPEKSSWAERLDIAKQAGFDFVEISIDESDERVNRLNWSAKELADLQNAINNSGVRIKTMCLSAHRKYALGSADVNIRSSANEIMNKAINFAQSVGIRVIQLAGYYVYYEEHTQNSRQYYRDGLAKGLELASSADVTLALENVDGNDVDSITKAMEFVHEFNSPWFQVYPDIGNLAEHGLDVCHELELANGHLVGVHVKDVRKGEPRRVPFGAGIVNFPEAFSQLKKMNFQSPIMLEMWNDDSPDCVNIVKNSRLWILDKMRKGGLIN